MWFDFAQMHCEVVPWMERLERFRSSTSTWTRIRCCAGAPSQQPGNSGTKSHHVISPHLFEQKKLNSMFWCVTMSHSWGLCPDASSIGRCLEALTKGTECTRYSQLSKHFNYYNSSNAFEGSSQSWIHNQSATQPMLPCQFRPRICRLPLRRRGPRRAAGERRPWSSAWHALQPRRRCSYWNVSKAAWLLMDFGIENP